MPGKGRIVERDCSPDELDTLRAGAESLGLTLEEALVHLGATTRDIYLNDVAYWRNVPAGVWSYTIVGPREEGSEVRSPVDRRYGGLRSLPFYRGGRGSLARSWLVDSFGDIPVRSD